MRIDDYCCSIWRMMYFRIVDAKAVTFSWSYFVLHWSKLQIWPGAGDCLQLSKTNASFFWLFPFQWVENTDVCRKNFQNMEGTTLV